MFLNIDGINVFYEREKGEKTPVLLMHGWGCDVRVMRRIFYFLVTLGHEVVSIDFPGFGKSDPPPENFTVFDYATLTEKLIKQLFDRPIIALGHSFGGRIALILGDSECVEKLILVSSAGIKPRRKPSYFVKVGLYKFCKKVLKKDMKNAGSTDYKALSPIMKKVFVSVVNTDLTENAKKVSVPTLLIWGENDKETPLYMAKKLNKHIRGSRLVTLNGCGHFCFADDFNSFCVALLEGL